MNQNPVKPEEFDATLTGHTLPLKNCPVSLAPPGNLHFISIISISATRRGQGSSAYLQTEVSCSVSCTG